MTRRRDISDQSGGSEAGLGSAGLRLSWWEMAHPCAVAPRVMSVNAQGTAWRSACAWRLTVLAGPPSPQLRSMRWSWRLSSRALALREGKNVGDNLSGVSGARKQRRRTLARKSFTIDIEKRSHSVVLSL